MSRTVVVTGGTRGIGRAVAERFAAGGDQVVVTGRRPEVEVIADTIPARGIRVDLEQPASIEELAASLDVVDVLVNNAGGFVGAGGTAPPRLRDVAEHWRRTLAVNLVGAALVTEALQDHLEQGGSVVSIGSIGAEYAGNPYSAAKAALQAWSAGLAERLGPRGITVNAIAPGYVEDTDLFGGPLAHDRRAAQIARTFDGRPGHPDDVADLVHFLASDRARHLTGQTIHLNGGAHTTR